VGVAVTAALFFSAAATLVLGIVPGEVLRAAESAAHTLQAPPAALPGADPAAMNGMGQQGGAMADEPNHSSGGQPR
jgi:hypothetical protein